MGGVFDLDKLIGEGTRGYVRRVGNQSQPLGPNVRGDKKKKKAASGASGGLGNAHAMIQKKPEAVVKISGYGKGKGVSEAVKYAAKHGKTLEQADGSILKGDESINAKAKEMVAVQRRKHPRQRDSMNLILSMPAGTNPDKVLDAARAFGAAEFRGKRDFVFARHDNEPHPHVHFVVQMAGLDGIRLDPRKDDLQRWRELFAEKLREVGVEAAATPRRARGQSVKGERQKIVGMRERGAIPLRDAQVIAKVALQIEAGRRLKQPWVEAEAKRRANIKETYHRAADQLAGSAQETDRADAAALKALADNLSVTRGTREDALLRELSSFRAEAIQKRYAAAAAVLAESDQSGNQNAAKFLRSLETRMPRHVLKIETLVAHDAQLNSPKSAQRDTIQNAARGSNEHER